jgi:hypothetical protein
MPSKKNVSETVPVWTLIKFSADSPKTHVAETTREGQLSVCGGPRKSTPVDAGTAPVGTEGLEKVTCGICTTKLTKRFADTGKWAWTPPVPKPKPEKPAVTAETAEDEPEDENEGAEPDPQS